MSRGAIRSSGSGREAGRRRGYRAREAVPRSPLDCHRTRAEDVLEVGRGARIASGALRPFTVRLDLDDLLPARDRIAVAMLLGKQRSFMVQGARIPRVEAQHASKRRRRVRLPPRVVKRLAEGEQRLEVERIALQQLDHRLKGLAGTA